MLCRLMIGSITLILVLALGMPLLLYLMQDRLIFFPQPAPPSPPRAPDYVISEVKVITADGLSLRGWLAKPSSAAGRLPLAVYFGGNAEETSHMAASAGNFPGWSLLTVNYRGYGGNPGRPSERALFADALAVHDFAARRADVDPARIVAIGRSLGSGAAVYLSTSSSQQPTPGLSSRNGVDRKPGRNWPARVTMILMPTRRTGAHWPFSSGGELPVSIMKISPPRRAI